MKDTGFAVRRPYPGLRPFRRDEADLFFGREDCVDALVNLLAKEHFLAVLGSSGTGKSSLVKTGLFNGLELGLMQQAGPRWRIAEFPPGEQPMRNLACALLQCSGQPARSEDIASLRTFLTRGPRSVVAWCKDGHFAPRENLLLVVDQFEELFHYQGYAGREEAEAFVALLLESSKVAIDVPIYVVLTMRSEYLGACSLIEGLAERMNAAQFLTPRLTRQQCRAAIEGPAEVCGITIEPSLVNCLLNELTSFAPWEDSDGTATITQLDRLARRADQLPLLQHALSRLWERAACPTSASLPSQKIALRLADYTEMGGLQHTLDRHANEVLNLLTEKDRLVAEAVFRALTTGTSVADGARRPRAFKALIEIGGGDEEGVRAVIDAFRAPDRNFLLPERDVPLTLDTRIDISHESVIRQWRQLSNWLDIEAQDAQQWRRLMDAAELERKGQGGLLQGLTLQNLLDWHKEAHPTHIWAERYGSRSSFEDAVSFLKRSEAAEAERQENLHQLDILRIKTDEEVARLRAEQEALKSWGQARRARLLTTRVAWGGALFAMFLASVAGLQWYVAAKQRLSAEQQTTRALLAQGRLLASLAAEETGSGDAVTGMLFALEALTSPYALGAQVALFAGDQARQEIAVLAGDTGPVFSASFSPDGRRVVTASADKTARIWEAKTAKEILVLRGHEGAVRSATFSPDGQQIVTASVDKTARIWDAETAKEIMVLRGHEGSVASAKYSPDGRRIVTASDDGTAQVWDASTAKEIAVLRGHDGAVRSAAFSPDGRRVVTASSDETARIWNVETWIQMAVLRGHVGQLFSAVFSPDGKRVATASADNTAQIWDAENYLQIGVFRGHNDQVFTAAFSPDGRRIITASADNTARTWDAEKFTLISMLRGHLDSVMSGGFSPDGTRVVTASMDKTTRMWDTQLDPQVAVLKGHKDAVRGAEFSPDGGRVATASDDRTARIWDAETAKEIVVLRGHEGSVASAKFSPDGRQIITASDDDTARIWDASTAKEIAVLRGHDGAVRSAAFSPDGRRVVTASADGSARIWNVETWTQMAVLKGHVGQLFSAVFSPDGTRVVTAAADKTAVIWDVATVSQIATLEGSDGQVFGAAFSPDGRRVVTASADKTAVIWDAMTPAQIATLTGSDGQVFGATFSPDGRRVLTASADSAARIWDAETFAQMARLEGPAGQVFGAAFSPDGKRVVTASAEKIAQIWPVFPTIEALVDHAIKVVPRCLTQEQRNKAFLDPTPPLWCIEKKKWPYDTSEWASWLAKYRGEKPPSPGASAP